MESELKLTTIAAINTQRWIQTSRPTLPQYYNQWVPPKRQQVDWDNGTSVTIKEMCHISLDCRKLQRMKTSKGKDKMLEHVKEEKSDGDGKEVRYDDDDGEDEVLGARPETLMILKQLIGNRKEETNEESNDEVDQEETCGDC